MAKETRKDSKGRNLRTGESQAKSGPNKGRYSYKYVDPSGKPQFLYSWRLEPHDKTPKGKRQDRSLREKIRDLQRDQLNGIDHSGANMTVLELYQKHIRLNAQVKPGTQGGRESRIKRLESDPLASMRICNVKLSDAKEWALRQQEKGLAYHTIRTDKRAFLAAFYTAMADDYIRKNPFDFQLTDVILDDTEVKTPLNAEQEKSLLDFLRTDHVYRAYYDEFVILLGTGLRISELCGLTKNDLDMEAGTITIDHQLLRLGEIGRYVSDPKTECGIRKISMREDVQEAFRRVLDRPRKSSVKIDGYTDFLFLARTGNPRTAIDYQNIFRRIREKHAKKFGPVLPENMTPHTMRHTFCTKMALAGMKPKSLQYIMGHKNIEITMNYYAHSDPDVAMDDLRRVQIGPASAA